tara:strand:+ start:273 stop:497 length:225 start_codon:yes stop_codon:yes gene_type:complete
MAIKKKTYKKRTIDLTGPDGNAYFLLGTANSLCKQLGFEDDVKQKISDEMTSGDYENLIETFDKYFGSIIDLER